jgi:hypothetical protein
MSAWYVLSAMGFYQPNPGKPDYVIGSPLFPRVTLRLSNGRTFTVRTTGTGPYISSASKDGSTLPRSWFSHEELMQGGELRLSMSTMPDTVRGSASGDHPPTPKQRQVALTPFVTPSRPSFTDEHEISLDCLTPGAKITYTTDGSDPTEKSATYSSPFVLRASTTVKARSFAPGRHSSGIMEATFTKTTKLGSVVESGAYSRQYTGGGNDALIDGVRGVEDFRVGGWQGYEGNDLSTTIDLGSVKHVRTISATFLQEISTDGQSYQQVFEGGTGIGPEKEGAVRHTVSAKPGEIRARYIRVNAANIGVCPAWHKGSGGKAWLFADEIEVE